MRIEDIDRSKLSPMMRQYLEIKEKYKDYVLFFRVGDFYEMFFGDAIAVSKAIGLTLTGKDCGLDERAPMCGVPFHACDEYAKKLIEAGFMVAVCEQLEDPASTKTLVKRDVIRVITPGTVIEDSMLDETSNNYLCCFYAKNKEASLCFADISTGEVHLFEIDGKELTTSAVNELARFSPVEVLVNDGVLSLKDCMSFIKQKIKASVTLLEEGQFSAERHYIDICKQFSAESLDEIGLDKDSIGACSVSGLFTYIKDTQKALVGRFSKLQKHESDPVMTIGFTARRNLELTETLRNKERKGSLIWVLDHTKTSMGKRMLKTCIEQPLINPVKIIERLNAVELLTKTPVELGELKENLSGVYDIERLMTRVMYKTANPRDLKSLSLTALKLPAIKAILAGFNSKLLSDCNNRISTLDAISSLVENAIVDLTMSLTG